jgi:transposase
VLATLDSYDLEPPVLVLTLSRRAKKLCAAAAGRFAAAFTTAAGGAHAISSAGIAKVYVDFEMRRVACKACGVKNEKLAFVSSNTKYTLRFAMQIGGPCRVVTIQDVARLMHLHWHAVRDLDKIYMREQLRVAADQKPRVIGIDEISIKKGHSYRIVVSDLVARRAIWFGGTGRTEADMDLFYAFLGKQNSRKIRLAVMDMWKPFRVSTQHHAPKAVIMFDKFHIVKHLGDALDAIRRSEYKRVTGEDRSFIKGQRYVLLSRRENLTPFAGQHPPEHRLSAS